MIPLRLELSLQCIACHAPIALNAITPHVTCGSCGRTVSLGVDRWRELLRAPLEEASSMRADEQRDASFDSPEGVCRRVYRREPPRCVACADAIAPEAAAASAQPSGWLGCAKCHRSILTRALPTITAGVACFVGEDVDLAFDRAQQQKEPVAIACPSCGGALPADGSARVFACKFCQATVHLPDDVWARIHPTRPVQPFWALVAVTAAPSAHATPSYGAVRAAAIDAAGNVYLAAENAVYSLDPHMNPRWVRADIHVQERMFMLWPDGRIWVHGRVSPVLLACEDGRDLGPGRAFSHGRFTTYTVQGASVIVSENASFDGDFGRISRMDLDGTPLSLYRRSVAISTAKKGFFGQLLEDPRVELPDFILRLEPTRLFASPDGDILEATQSFQVERGLHVLRIIRRTSFGDQRWQVHVPVDGCWLNYGRLFPLSDGTALAHARVEPLLSRVGPGGMQPLLPPHRAAELCRKSTCVMVTPEGDILLFGERADIVRLAPDGREIWSNEAAKAVERERIVAAQRN